MKNNLIFGIILMALFTVFTNKNINAGNPSANNTVKGEITDQCTNTGVAFTSVALFDKSNNLVSYGTMTDSKGNFNLKNLPNGKYKLVAYRIGYNKKSISNVEISGNNHLLNLGNIKLDENLNQNYFVEKTCKNMKKNSLLGCVECNRNSNSLINVF